MEFSGNPKMAPTNCNYQLPALARYEPKSAIWQQTANFRVPVIAIRFEYDWNPTQATLKAPKTKEEQREEQDQSQTPKWKHNKSSGLVLFVQRFLFFFRLLFRYEFGLEKEKNGGMQCADTHWPRVSRTRLTRLIDAAFIIRIALGIFEFHALYFPFHQWLHSWHWRDTFLIPSI